MKTILLSVLLCLIIKCSTAQITKHNWLVGGNGFFNSTTYNSTATSGERVTTVQLMPNIGYFIADKFAAGLKFDFELTRNKSTNQNSFTKGTTYSFGPFVRYYFLPVDKLVNLLVEGNYQYGIERVGGASAPVGQPLEISINQYKKNTFSILAGPVVYFNSSVGLEFLIGYATSKYVKFDGSNNSYEIGIGLQIHLEKEK